MVTLFSVIRSEGSRHHSDSSTTGRGLDEETSKKEVIDLFNSGVTFPNQILRNLEIG